MFRPKQLGTARPQKRRMGRMGGVWARPLGQLAHWPGVWALGPGFLAASVVDRLLTISKRVAGAAVGGRRFWLNLQVAGVVTRKPENVRMGKGKGARRGLIARVQSGVALVRFSNIRIASLRSLQRYLQARCSFRVRADQPHRAPQSAGFCGVGGGWITLKRLQPNYVTARFEEFREQLQRLRRPHLWEYFIRIFYWRYLAPCALWVPPKTARGRLRIRRYHLRRTRLADLVYPQGVGFLRQLRGYYREHRGHLQEFGHLPWRRCQRQWRQVLWRPEVLVQTPHLPWDLLLRSSGLRRFVPHIAWVAVLQPVGLGSGRGVYGQGGVGFYYRMGWYPRGLRPRSLPTFSQLFSLAQRVLLQVTVLVLYWYWALRLLAPVRLTWLDQ